MARFNIPIIAVFTAQVFLVIAGFVAVLSVLTIQHQNEYERAVYQNIQLRQENANIQLKYPFLLREGPLEKIAYRMRLQKSLIFNRNRSLSAIVNWFDYAMVDLVNDPLMDMIIQITESDIPHPKGGQNYWDVAVVTKSPLWCAKVISGMADIYPQYSYPLDFSMSVAYPYDVSYESWVRTVRRNTNYSSWHPPNVIPNNITGDAKFLTAYSIPLLLDPLNASRVTSALTFTTDVWVIDSIVRSALLTPQSVALLFNVPSNNLMVSTDPSFPLFRPDTSRPLWDSREIPHPEYSTIYSEARSRCGEDSCTQLTFERGDQLVSIIHVSTETQLSFHLLQITPRSYFFEESERSRAVGIGLGVAAALLVLISCVVVYFSIHGPLSRVELSMGLAAIMKNEEANEEEGARSVLSEINNIQNAFASMNQRLLQARPFLPQHLLLENLGDEEEENNEDDEEEEVAGILSDISLTLEANGNHSQPSPGGQSLQTLQTAVENMSQSRMSKSKLGLAGEVSPLAKLRQLSTFVQLLGAKNSTKKVGLLYANLSDFHGLVANNSTDQAIAAQAALAAIVEDAAQRERGLIDTFQGDHFVVSFNVARSSANIGRAAALCALHMSAAVGTEPLLGGRSMSMGFAAGRALVGNMGTGAMKRLCTVGPVYGEAVALERLARHVGQRCLVSERSLDGVEMAAYTLVIGKTRIGKYSEPVFVKAIMQAITVGAADEWLYEVGEGAKNNPFKELSSSMVLYLNSRKEMGGPGFVVEEVQCFGDPLIWAGDRLTRFESSGPGQGWYDLMNVGVISM